MATKKRGSDEPNPLAIPAGINKRIDYPPEAYRVSHRQQPLQLHTVDHCL